MARNYELIWSRRALVDLTSTLDYIAQDEPVAATDLARALKTKVDNLRTAPLMGREIRPGLRELVVHRHYVVSYRVSGDQIQILKIRHAAQQP